MLLHTDIYLNVHPPLLYGLFYFCLDTNLLSLFLFYLPILFLQKVVERS